jgi:hypothetical protein
MTLTISQAIICSTMYVGSIYLTVLSLKELNKLSNKSNNFVIYIKGAATHCLK